MPADRSLAVDLHGADLTTRIARSAGGVPVLVSGMHGAPFLLLTIGAISGGRHALLALDRELSLEVVASPEAAYQRMYEAQLAAGGEPRPVFVGPLARETEFLPARTLVADCARIAATASGHEGWTRATLDDVLRWVDALDARRRTESLSLGQRIYGVAAVALLLAYRVGVRSIDHSPISAEMDPATPVVPLAVLSDYRAIDVLGIARIAERTRADERVTLRDLFAMSLLLLDRDALPAIPRELLAPDVEQRFVVPTENGLVASVSPPGEPFLDPERNDRHRS